MKSMINSYIESSYFVNSFHNRLEFYPMTSFSHTCFWISHEKESMNHFMY